MDFEIIKGKTNIFMHTMQWHLKSKIDVVIGLLLVILIFTALIKFIFFM